LDVSQPVDLHLAIRFNTIRARSLTADASNTKLEVLDCAGEDLEIGHYGSLAALAGLRNFKACGDRLESMDFGGRKQKLTEETL
jgi:hypothetical protein